MHFGSTLRLPGLRWVDLVERIELGGFCAFLWATLKLDGVSVALNVGVASAHCNSTLSSQD